MTKTRTSRFISMLICVCMAVLCIQGLSFRAAADEVYEEFTTTDAASYTGEHFQITQNEGGGDGSILGDGDGLMLGNWWLTRDTGWVIADAITVSSLHGEKITRIEAYIGYMESHGILPDLDANIGTIEGFSFQGNGSVCTITISDINDTSVQIYNSNMGDRVGNYSFVQIKNWKIYYDDGIHTHNYAFSAEGDTISITCDKAGCTEPPYTASITLVAPTLTTEGGEDSPEATVLCTDIDEDFLAYWDYNSMEDLMADLQGAIVYYNGEEELAEAPTEAGDYTAELTFYDNDVEYTATISYTIAEATPTPAPSAPIVISGTAKAASGGAPGLVSGTGEADEMLTWNAKLDGKTLTWEAKDGADGFVISIRAKGAKAFKRFARVTEKSADLSKLKPGTYTVYVRYEKDGKLAKCRQSARTTIKIG